MESIFMQRWREKVIDILKLHYPDMKKKDMESHINKIIEENLSNPKAAIVNNYINRVVKTDVLSIVDSIERNSLIIGGGGVLYQPHNVKENPLLDFIKDKMASRSIRKDNRELYSKGSDEWLMEDIAQLILKILINTLYGVMGYPGFVLYNLFIAESITNQGKQIVCTAIQAFENFLSDAVKFSTNGELYEYIGNIHTEYNEKYKGKLDTTVFEFDNIDEELSERLISKCAFNVDEKTELSIEKMISNMDNSEKYIMYYKNNLEKFNYHKIIKDKLTYIMSNINILTAGETSLVEDETLQKMIGEMWELYEVFVFYDYPIFDRVRKAMYIDKKNVIYVDTDSNFLGLIKYVEFLNELDLSKSKTEQELSLTSVNLLVIFLSLMVNKSLYTLAKFMNSPDEYANRLHMKNELVISRILLVLKKKRYIANALSQEGKILGDGLGMSEIKGFDFIKSTTKPFVKEYFTDICLNDILRAEKIDVANIFKKLVILREDIEISMKKGESKYFKQANVKTIENYKNPYSTQGIKSIMLWNTLSPSYSIELPGDVDIIPIKDFSFKKPATPKENKTTNTKAVKAIGVSDDRPYLKNRNVKWLYDNYPEVFKLIEKNIYLNPNPEIRHMGLNFIAKPKNTDIPTPEWFHDIIDTEKVVVSTLKLFSPILSSLGLNNLKVSSTVSYPSNMIDL